MLCSACLEIFVKIMESLPEKCRPKRLRFTYNDDLTFLKEVVSENPFRDPSAWVTVQKNVEILIQKSFTIKTLKNHLELLLEAFIKKDKVDQMRSGVEEPYCELDDLLREISLITQQYKGVQVQKKKINKDKQLSELGKAIREKYASSFTATVTEASDDVQQYNKQLDEHDYHMSAVDVPVGLEVTVMESGTNGQILMLPSPVPTETRLVEECAAPKPSTTEAQRPSTPSTNKLRIQTPSRQRQNRASGLRKSSLCYLSEKQEKDREIRVRELELEERKIALEERKIAISERKMNLEEARFELEKRERLNKIQTELEEKKITLQLLKSQQEFIENVMQGKNPNC